MAYSFSQAQVNEISARLGTANSTNNYAPVYQYIFDQLTLNYVDNHGLPISQPQVGVDASVWLWVRGAKGVNANDGSYFTKYIRDWTKAEYQVRYGKILTDADIQTASNKIIKAFAEDITADGLLPSLKETAIHDAGQIASGIFGNNYSPWAGTILFSYLGNGALPGETIADNLFKQWVLTNSTVPNPAGGYFKAIPGTYDLVAAAQTAHEIAGFWDTLAARDELAYTIDHNSIGRATTISLLTALRTEANTFFQQAYALPNEGQWQVGGDLPLYPDNAFISGADYYVRPNYLTGRVDDDQGLWAIRTNNTNPYGYNTDIVNAGSGNDLIYGSLGKDLIDGSEGVDTLDWSGFTNGITAIQENVSGTLYKDRLVITNSQDASITYAYGVEKIVGTLKDDKFTIFGSADQIIDTGAGIDRVVLNKRHTFENGDAIYITDAVKPHHTGKAVILNAEKFDVLPGLGYFVVEKMGNEFTFNRYKNLETTEPYSTTISYKNYTSALTFNLQPSTPDGMSVRDAQGNVDKFNNLPFLIGTNKGDTYLIDDNYVNNNYPFIGPKHIFTGSGNDTISGSGTNSLVFYGGGNDRVLSGTGKSLVMPFGIKVSDLSFAIENVRVTDTTHFDNGSYSIDYTGDIRLKINGYGSILYEDKAYRQFVHTEAEGYIDGYHQNASLHTIVQTENGLTSLDLFLTNPISSTNDATYGIPIYEFRISGTSSLIAPNLVGVGFPTSFGLNYYQGSYQGSLGNDVFDLNTFISSPDVYAHDGNDTITGSAVDNRIYGGDGTDIISGNGGNDTIYGGAGIDTIIFNGLYANYTITSLTQNNLSYIAVANNAGSDGVDKVYDAEELKFLDGVYKNGTFNAGQPSSSFNVSAGNDSINAKAATAALNINLLAGNDVILASSYNDNISGGDGNDIIEGAVGNDTLNGNAGSDTVQYTTATSGVTVNLSLTSAQNTGGAGTDTISNFENISGSLYNDVLIGDANANDIYGGNGNDTLEGGAGSNRLNGGLGSDTYKLASVSNNIISEVDGNNNLVIALARSMVTAKLNGITMELSNASGSFFTKIDDYRNFVNFTFNDTTTSLVYLINPIPGIGNDVFTGLHASEGVNVDLLAGDDRFTGSSFNDTVLGNLGADILTGARGNDNLSGGAGNDNISGEDGDDILTGDTGDDYLSAGYGNDTYKYNLGDGSDTIIDHSGTDNIILGAGFSVTDITTQKNGNNLQVYLKGIQAFTIQNQFVTNYIVETVTFSNGVVYQLNSTPLTYTGTAAADTLRGTDASSDTLNGLGGNDYIGGLGGDDTLIGGTGQDTLEGGMGNDVYVFAAGDSLVSAPDTINLILDEGADTIKLTGGILPQNVQFYKDPGVTGLWHLKYSPSDEILIQGWKRLSGTTMQGTNYTVSKISFDNGTVWDFTQGMIVNDSDQGNSIQGGALADTINGNGGNDYINAKEGNDIITGGTGNDSIYGGAGDDVYIFKAGDGADYITDVVGEGIDTIKLTGGILPQNVYLTIESMGYLGIQYTPTDKIIAQASTSSGSRKFSVEKIVFDNGAIWDLTAGLTLTDNNDAHDVYGTDFSDVINANGGDDRIFANAGNDTVNAGAGNDSIYDLSGSDTLNGGDGNDFISGGSNGLFSVDSGVADNDIIDGGKGVDNLYGSWGDDTYVFRAGDSPSSNPDMINEVVGQGTDTIKLTGGILPQNVTVTKLSSNVWYSIKFGSDEIRFINHVPSGGNMASTNTLAIEKLAFDNGTILNIADIVNKPATPPPAYVATTGNDTINASASTVAVTLALLAGNDTYRGSNFNDVITGDDGNDTIEGGGGNDMLSGSAGTDMLSYANAGAAVTINLATTTAQNTGGAGTDTISTFENVMGSAYNDTLTGDANANIIKGGAGNDIIQGGAGNDILDGEAGTDTVTYAAATAAVTINLTTTTSQATGGAGSDTITNFENLTGSGYNDTLRGNTANNTLTGGNGNDILYGNSGNDLLYGDAGTDTLYGDAGNDTLNGGAANDVLYGGAGADIFKFSSGGGIETIKDFNKTETDKIDIKDLLSGYDPVTKAITDFIQITSSGAHSIIKIDANGLTGGTAWTQIATIENVTGLTDEAALKAAGTIIA